MDDAKTFVRSVVLPVSVPLGADPTGAPWTWETFTKGKNGEFLGLNDAFRLSTDLANWCVRRLFVLDDPASEKTPDVVKKWYGYKDAGEHYPDKAKWSGAMASLNIVTRTAQRKYVQQRFDVMVRHDSSLLTYRFPQPFPVHNACWQTDYADGGFPTVRLSLPGVGQVELRLKRDGGFRRQLAMFRQLHLGGQLADLQECLAIETRKKTVESTKKPPDLTKISAINNRITEIRERIASHRLAHPDLAEKGEAALYRDRKGQLLLKMVGHFPRHDRGGADNVCFLHTDPNALLVAEINGRSVTVTNGDHLKRAHAVVRETADRHRRFLQRVGEDKKREVRMDPRQRGNLNRKVDERCAKQRARIDTAVKQIAAQVARFCERQRVGLVAYDDANKDFLPDGFPWHALKTRICQLFVGETGGEWVDGQFTHITEDEERREWLTRARATAAAGSRAVAHSRRAGSHPAVTPTSPPTPSRPPTSSRGSARR